MTIPFDDRPRPVKLAAVLHTAQTPDRTLLASFAADLRSRGWRVAGLADENRGDSDLVVGEIFGDHERLSGEPADGILAAAAKNPVLVSVPAAALESWLSLTGGAARLLPNDVAQLWRWWGGGNLLEELIRGVAARPVNRVVLGLNWTLVESDVGTGIAHSPVKGGAGCRPIAGAGEFHNHSLQALAERARSWNPFDVALGIAAINANYNRYDLAGSDLNGLDAFSGIGGPVTAVGRFPDLTSRFEAVDVIELMPRDDEYPEIATERLLARSAAAIVTASSLVNGSLPRILDARGPATRLALVGPGTPLAPALHAYGIECLSGIVIEDPPAVAKLIAEGGSVSALKRLGRQVTLTAQN